MLTDLNFLNVGSTWPPESEIERLKKYHNNRLLFKGKHELVYKNWIKLLRNDQNATLELIFNWHKKLSLLWADFLLSEPPRITAGKDDSKEQKEVESIIENNNLVNTAYEVSIDVSRYGTGLYHVYSDGTKGVIEPTQPGIWFPVCSADNIKKINFHVLAWMYSENKIDYLKVQIHEVGKYTEKILRLKDNKILSQVSSEVKSTGLSDFAIIPAHNTITSDECCGMDDYEDIDSIIQELELRVSQISRILDKHSDPNMYGDESALEEDPDTGESTFRGGGKYFPVPAGGTAPGYIVWNAQLEANWKEIEILMDQLYIISETSPACFGNLKAGIVESGSALKRLMIAPLSKVQRIRMRMDPALKKAIRLCSEINGGVKLDKVNIAWQDGIPTDELEMSNIMAIRTGATGGAKTISAYTAIKRLDNKTDSEVLEEMDRIAEDVVAANPIAAPTFEDKKDVTPPEGGVDDGGDATSTKSN